MCTVTILQLEDGGSTVRLACNRDETPARPAALPPEVRTLGERRALMPIDPVSDGTWIGVNNDGILATLLNAYPSATAPLRARKHPRASRGRIIPALLATGTLEAALDTASSTDAEDCEPFRLILADRVRVAEIYSDGSQLKKREPAPREEPLMYASSGLGDALVDAPRRELFHAMLREASDLRTMQDAYHRHSWPDRRHLSVCMQRDEAQTVSWCVIELRRDRAVMWYYPQPPDGPGPVSEHTLPMRT